MNKRLALFTLIVLLAGPAQAHHKKGHQNTEPWPEFNRVDCGKLSNYIDRMEALFGALLRIGKSPTPGEAEALEKARFLYGSRCFEI